MELLAPAGDYASVLAAVNNGADAIYLGGKRFHARQKNVSFTQDDLLRSLDYVHQHGRKAYVTLNILLDSSEAEEALDDAYDLYRMGADGLIVQDIGLMQMLSEALPQMRLHASTQATVYQADGLRFMQQFGVKRTVLARELSLEEIIHLHRAVPDMELEVFVHGALCYSYSGQCLFSSLAGGRSGNRGRCAQPCRKPYRLMSQAHPDGITLPVHSRYLLSTADQCLLESLPLLEKAGVSSLKIEGRLKRPEYVAVVTRCYREVLDYLPEILPQEKLQQMQKDMKGMFNRDFTQDYLLGNKRVLRIDRPDNRGILLGKVEGKENNKIFIRLQEEIRQNDGILLKGIHGEEISFALRQLEVGGRLVNQALPGEILALQLKEKVLAGEKVYKTRDSLLIHQVQESLREQKVDADDRIPVKMVLNAEIGKPLYLMAEDFQGRKAEIQSEMAVTEAEKQPLVLEKVHEKLARLGNTPFVLHSLEAHMDDSAMFPFGELNRMRRTVIEKLEKQSQPAFISEKVFLKKKDTFYRELYETDISPNKERPRLHVHTGDIRAAEAAVEAGADKIILDIEPFVPVHYSLEEVKKLIQKSHEYGSSIVLAVPRIHRRYEENQKLNRWAQKFSSEEFLLETWGDIVWAQRNGLRFSTDYSLNISNEVSYQKAVQDGADCVCLSVEMNAGQMKEFYDLSHAEIVIHGELILMVSEGCILYHTMPLREDGGCMHHCARDHYGLVDEKKYQFPLAHDAYCRQYIFNSRTLCLWEELADILSMNPRALRIEAQRYAPEQISRLIMVYKEYLEKPYEEEKQIIQGKEILKESAFSSFTRGHYLRGVL